MGVLSEGICNSSGIFLLLYLKRICGMKQWSVTVTYDKILITIHSSTGHCEAECMKTVVNTEWVLNHDGFLSLNRFHNEVAQNFYFNKLPSSLPSASLLRNGSLSLQPVGSAVCLQQRPCPGWAPPAPGSELLLPSVYLVNAAQVAGMEGSF